MNPFTLLFVILMVVSLVAIILGIVTLMKVGESDDQNS